MLDVFLTEKGLLVPEGELFGDWAVQCPIYTLSGACFPRIPPLDRVPNLGLYPALRVQPWNTI